MSFRANFEDVSQLADELGSSFDLEVSQLSKGPFTGHLSTWMLPGVGVSHGRLNKSVQIAGITHNDVTLLVMDPDCEGAINLNGCTLQPQDVLATPRGAEHRFVLPEGFQGVVMQFRHPLLAGHEFPLEQFLPRANVLCSFAHSVASLGADLSDECRVALGKRCLELLLRSTPSRESMNGAGSLSSRRRAALQAADLIHHDPRAPLTLKILCDHTNVSERALRDGFVEVFGLPPKEYLTALRLNLARRRLRGGEPGLTVRRAAVEQGFWHIPRFSGFYQRFFGELPSETLRRAARKVGADLSEASRQL